MVPPVCHDLAMVRQVVPTTEPVGPGGQRPDMAVYLRLTRGFHHAAIEAAGVGKHPMIRSRGGQPTPELHKAGVSSDTRTTVIRPAAKGSDPPRVACAGPAGSIPRYVPVASGVQRTEEELRSHRRNCRNRRSFWASDMASPAAASLLADASTDVPVPSHPSRVKLPSGSRRPR